jgi:hypothetical protein
MSGILFRTLADATLRSSLVALLVAAILAGTRVRSAGLRHASWTAVLCAMLTMPLLAYWAPAIVISLPVPRSLASLGASLKPPEGAGSVHRPERPTTGHPAWQAVATPAASAPAQLPAGLTDGLDSPAPVWLLPCLSLYVIVVLALSLRCWLGWRAAGRMASEGRPIELPGACRVIGPATRVAIRESAAMVTPVTIGAFTLTILLPVAWQVWSQETVRAVLAHELAHVRRRDPLVRLLAHINRCLFWFHPLAWWMERTLAAAAEHASDDEAVRTIGEPGKYAAILVEMARAVHQHGGRLSWQGVGIDGDLPGRVDRILHGDPWREASRRHKGIVAASCVAAIVLAIACRPQLSAWRGDSTASIEQRDRQLRVELRHIWMKRSEDLAQVDWTVAPNRVEDLETSLKRNPEDLAVLKATLIDEWMQPQPARRAHILWLIEHHPDAPLAGSLEARLFPKDVALSNQRGIEPSSVPGDAVGYEQAKVLWLAHANRPDVSVRVLENASHFFEDIDNPLAEQMLLRARARDREGPWSARLGRLYAITLAGSSAVAARNRILNLSAGEPGSGYGAAVRKKLGESTDDVLLTAAGWFLLRAPGRFRSAFDADPGLWAQSCFKRALQINPQAVLAHTALLQSQQNSRGSEPLWRVPPASQYDSVLALPEAERFEQLPNLARSSYATVEDLGRWNDPNLRDRVELARQNAKKFAGDLLTLAPKYRTHPQYGTAIYMANMTLGALALRDGDKTRAVEFLWKASAAPSSETLAYADDIVSGLHWHLAGDLLKHGERKAVIAFLDRMAKINVAGRADLREAAAAIRRGDTPRL